MGLFPASLVLTSETYKKSLLEAIFSHTRSFEVLVFTLEFALQTRGLISSFLHCCCHRWDSTRCACKRECFYSKSCLQDFSRMVWVWLAPQHNHNMKWQFKKGFNYFGDFVNQNHQVMSIKIIKIVMIGKRMRLWEERGVIHVLCSNVISLGTAPVSKQLLFTLSLFVFKLKISHFRDKKKNNKPSGDTVSDRKESPEA